MQMTGYGPCRLWVPSPPLEVPSDSLPIAKAGVQVFLFILCELISGQVTVGHSPLLQPLHRHTQLQEHCTHIHDCLPPSPPLLHQTWQAQFQACAPPLSPADDLMTHLALTITSTWPTCKPRSSANTHSTVDLTGPLEIANDISI